MWMLGSGLVIIWVDSGLVFWVMDSGLDGWKRVGSRVL